MAGSSGVRIGSLSTNIISCVRETRVKINGNQSMKKNNVSDTILCQYLEGSNPLNLLSSQLTAEISNASALLTPGVHAQILHN